LVVPFTVAFMAVDWPAASELELGLSDTDMVGTNAMVALAVLVRSATLFTVKVMFCGPVRFIGTV
jgi:hypothetical protein